MKDQGTMIGAIYGRYSTHEQDTGSSKESQLSRAREKAASMGVVIPEEFIFFDEAYTGTKDTRPEFSRMIETADVRQPPFQILFCEDTSRFARNSLHAKLYKQTLKKRGVGIIYTAHDFGEDIEGEFIEGIMEQIDEFQSKQIRKKTIRHMVDNLKSGYVNGGRPPLGLKRKVILLDDETGKRKIKWVPDPETAPVVRRCFEMRAEGYGPAAIVKTVSGFTKPSGGKITVGDLNYWYRRCADTYAGRLAWNKSTDRGRTFLPESEWVIIPDMFEPIVPPAIADKVKEIYRDKISPVKTERKYQTRLYYGTSLMRCEVCGRSMNADKSGQRRSSYYVCYGYRRLKNCEHSRHYRVDIVDRGILDALNYYVFKVRTVEGWVNRVLKHVKRFDCGRYQREETELRTAKRECEERLERLKEAIASGTIPYHILSDKILKEDNQLVRINGYLDFLNSLKKSELIKPSRDDIERIVHDFRSVLDEGDQFTTKRLVNDVVESITVSADGKIRIVYDKNALIKGLNYPRQIVYHLGSLNANVRDHNEACPRLCLFSEHLEREPFLYKDGSFVYKAP